MSKTSAPASTARKKPAPKKKKRAPRGLNREQALDLYARLAQDRPDPETELNWTNPYTLVVAVALSAQATDVGVNKATEKLFQEADTPEKMVALGEDHVRDRIKTIGLFRNKAKNVIALSKLLIEKYDGEVPQIGRVWKNYPAWAARPPMSC